MTYAFGKTSQERVAKAAVPLRRVLLKAIELSSIDFGVTETLRTIERQKLLVRSGASRTMNSRHLPNKDGLSEASDLAAYLDTDGDGDKEFSWHWPHVFLVARAVQLAAKQLNIPIIWGCVWDKTLNELGPDLESEMAAYVARFKSNPANKGRNAFADGPHFQLA